MTKELITYQSNDGKISFNVNVFGETVWLTQKQMAELFDRSRVAITQHINNIFKEKELEEKVVCKDFLHTTEHGAIKGRNQIISTKYYNLDVIISVGYRVKSERGTQFRIWATKVLKQYMLNGYAINEARIKAIEEKIDNLSRNLKDELKKELKFEIKQINQTLLKIANRPITINNQIQIGSNELESKLIQLLDKIIKSLSKKKLKFQITDIKEEIIKSPKDDQTKNKILNFFEQIGDSNSKLHKTIIGAKISAKMIKELVKLGEKLRDLIF